MRVLHILGELKPSGAEAMLRAAAPFWRNQQIEGEILCTGESIGSYAEALRAAGYRIHHISFARSVRFFLAICRFFHYNKFGVVHLHTERANFWYALIAFLSGNRKIVRTVHYVFAFHGVLRVRRRLQRYLSNRMFSVVTIAISPSVQECEKKHFRNNTVLIPNWFDSDAYRPAAPETREAARAELGVDQRTLAISTVGGCWAYKNHGAIVKAVAQLARHVDVVYLHAGQERHDCDERRLAEALATGGRVRFLGVVPDIADVYNASDLFIMPSTSEGFGVAAVEAMGAGLPVVLSDVVGLRDFRSLEAPVYWIQPTAEDIVKALLHFYEMPDANRRSIGNQLSEKAHAHLGISTGAGAYARLYATLALGAN